MDITFPTTAEAFIAYQEAEIHRRLSDTERRFAAAIVDIINISYQDGAEGEENTITMEFVRKFHREREDDPNKCRRIWESVCWWCDRAYMAGKETQRKTW